MWIAKFEDAGDVWIDAPDADAALRMLVAHGFDEEPTQVVEVPPGIFCAEVFWADDGDGEGVAIGGESEEENPANLSAVGVVFEPSAELADYMETEARATGVRELVAANEG